jgi:hypothetical protein
MGEEVRRVLVEAGPVEALFVLLREGRPLEGG